MPFLLICPRCKNRMKYAPRDGKVHKKTKQCVYCGYNMTVTKYILKLVE